MPSTVHPAFTEANGSCHLGSLASLTSAMTKTFRRHEVKRTSLRRAVVPAVATFALALAASGCAASNESASGSDGDGGLSGTLAGGGASSQEAAQEAWIAGFQTDNPDVTVTYDPVGSGGGRETFISGGFPFAGSDAYLTD